MKPQQGKFIKLYPAALSFNPKVLYWFQKSQTLGAWGKLGSPTALNLCCRGSSTPGTFSSFFSFERHVPWWVERLQPGWELLLALPLAFTTAKENRPLHLSKPQLHHCSNLATSSSHSRVAPSKGADAWKQTLDTSGCEIQFSCLSLNVSYGWASSTCCRPFLVLVAVSCAHSS